MRPSSARGPLRKGQRAHSGKIAAHVPAEAAAPSSGGLGGSPLSAPQASSVAQQSKRGPGGLSEAQGYRNRPPVPGISNMPSTTEPYYACPHSLCEAIIDPKPIKVDGHWKLPGARRALEGSGEGGGYNPQDLQSAYNVPATGGEGNTIALVDAGGYATAEADLAKYRSQYGLPACTSEGKTEAEKCLRIINQTGEEANYPPSAGWEDEEALDLDMASAACPRCRLMLVEANSTLMSDLGASANKAAEKGANEISNSYGAAEEAFNSEELNGDYHHEGVMVTAAAGDGGYLGYLYGQSSLWYPAAQSFVVSVGGTELFRATNSRGWSEETWGASGGGCSLSEQKPVWQTDTACAHRTDNDVSAVASPGTPVSVYLNGSWGLLGGTSASSPLVAGIEAHASAFAHALPGADGFYSDEAAAFDVTTGANAQNGECEIAYLCTAGVGYDAPTGVGSPNGPLLLSGLPPIAGARAPSALTATTATLNGVVDPQGSETSYHFEYGTSTAYGNSTGSVSVGSGTSQVAASQSISGLQANTTYHYRLVAANSSGTAHGQDTVFRTAAPTVTGVTPNLGPAAGGASVTISGTSFAGVSSVKFGATAARSFTVSSETSLKAVTPPGTGTVDATVTTPAGTSSVSATDHFTYEPSVWSTENVPLFEGGTVSFGSAVISCSFTPWSCGGVSCASRAFCVAAGMDNFTSIEESWNGSTWSDERFPVAEQSSQTSMTGVSCASTTACMVVGYDRNASNIRVPAADYWNGNRKSNGEKEWVVSSMPLPGEAKEAGFEGVSCPSPSECMAVGLSVSTSGTELPLIAQWKAGAGSGTWTVQTLESLPGATTSILEGVSCPTSASCTAVGFTASAETQGTLVESWNGAKWTPQSAAVPPGASRLRLNGVSCVSPGACTAVGSYMSNGGLASLAERSSGESWTIQSTANTGRQEELNGVSCSSSEECTATGEYQGQRGTWTALVQKWTGVAWSVQATTVPETLASELHSVSCALESVCASVGTSGWSAEARSRGGAVRPLVMTRSETTMGIQATPTPSGASHVVLSGSSCVSSTACTEVGSYRNSGGTTLSLADAWNGFEWKTQTPSNPSGATAAELHRVSCTSATECTAVGSYKNSSGTILTLAERFNGSTWTIQSTPNPSRAREAQLTGVACTSATSCSAVGFARTGPNSSSNMSLAETWNGSEWKIQTTENPSGATNVRLLGVSCATASACTAVGTYTNSSANTVSLAERLSGSEWKLQSTPNPSGGKNVELNGVSCPSASSCTAVGSYANSSGNIASLAERWNGSEWLIQALEGPAGAAQSKLLGDSCTPSGRCTAVGWSKASTANATPLAELWNGREWQSWVVPSPSTEGGELLDVSCLSMYACEAAGTYINSSKVQVSLAEGLGPPAASTGQAKEVGHFNATLTGSVQQNQWITSYHFEYGATTSYGTSVPVPNVGLISQTGVNEVQQSVGNLHEGTTYHFRLVAASDGGTTYGPDQTFTTVPTPTPGATTGVATNVTWNVAVLSGVVTPNNWPTTYDFEYGPTTAYGAKIPVPEASVKSETTAEEVKEKLTGLVPSKTYHYRFVANNSGNIKYGEDKTFTTAAASVTPAFQSSFGSQGSGAGQLSSPASVTVDESGNEWVADRANNRVDEFSSTGEFKLGLGWGVVDGAEKLETCTTSTSCRAGLTGPGTAEFGNPEHYGGQLTGIVASGGHIWVLDAGNLRLLEFSTSGEYIKQITGVLIGANGIAADAAGNLYVSDYGYGGVQVFSATSGNQLRIFYPSSGTPIYGVTIDPEGNVWTTSAYYHRIEESSSAGALKMMVGWGVSDGAEKLETCTTECKPGIAGAGSGQFYYPNGIAADTNGDLWVVDAADNRVQELSPHGEYITQFASAGSGEGQLSGPSAIAISNGFAYIADTGNNRVEKWDVTAPTNTASFGSQGTGPGQLSSPASVTVDESGNEWVADRANNRVDEFSSTGEFKLGLGWGVIDGAEKLETCTASCRAGLTGAGTAEFGTPEAYGQQLMGIVAVGGHIWVLDSGNLRLLEFSTSGEYIKQITGVRIGANGVATDAADNLYVSDYGYGAVQVFSATSGEELRIFYPSGGPPIYGVAVDAEGNVWTTSSYYHRIEESSSAGALKMMVGWGVKDAAEKLETCTSECKSGIAGAGNGQFYYPGGITVDRNGELWVVDAGDNRVQELSPQGEYLIQFGSLGSGVGQLSSPSAIAISNGFAYVADTGNNRVEKWALLE
jgi:streptogramin lyase